MICVGRYLATMVGGKKNLNRSAVAAELMNAFVSQHASAAMPAVYRSSNEQAILLDATFKKWVGKDVWTPASRKVCV